MEIKILNYVLKIHLFRKISKNLNVSKNISFFLMFAGRMWPAYLRPQVYSCWWGWLWNSFLLLTLCLMMTLSLREKTSQRKGFGSPRETNLERIFKWDVATSDFTMQNLFKWHLIPHQINLMWYILLLWPVK